MTGAVVDVCVVLTDFFRISLNPVVPPGRTPRQGSRAPCLRTPVGAEPHGVAVGGGLCDGRSRSYRHYHPAWRCLGTWWAPPPSKRLGWAIPIRRVRFPSISANRKTSLRPARPEGLGAGLLRLRFERASGEIGRSKYLLLAFHTVTFRSASGSFEKPRNRWIPIWSGFSSLSADSEWPSVRNWPGCDSERDAISDR